MLKTPTQLAEIKLVGICVRTRNAAEIDPSTAKICATAQKYFSDAVATRITNRKSPGLTYCVYTDYESDVSGEYTYFIGEEVTSIAKISEELTSIIIPTQNYTKFTTDPGAMPAVCINAWQNIWQMPALELGGERAYNADFEIYDERAADPLNTALDLYIGIK